MHIHGAPKLIVAGRFLIFPLGKVKSRVIPGRLVGLMISPPSFFTKSPLTASALSRISSASSRNRDWRATSRLSGSIASSSLRGNDDCR
jgi:hypothetical protein